MLYIEYRFVFQKAGRLCIHESRKYYLFIPSIIIIKSKLSDFQLLFRLMLWSNYMRNFYTILTTIYCSTWTRDWTSQLSYVFLPALKFGCENPWYKGSWGQQDPGGPHVNLAIWDIIRSYHLAIKPPIITAVVIWIIRGQASLLLRGTYTCKIDHH